MITGAIKNEVDNIWTDQKQIAFIHKIINHI